MEDYTPSPVETWNLRRLLHSLAPAGTDKQAQLSVLAFAADAPALSAVAQLAGTAARLGTQVALVAGDDPSLALLRAALQIRSSSGSPADTFYFESDNGGSEFSSLRLTISLVALGEVKPDFGLSGGANLLAVSAGFATAESLAVAVLSASDAHHPIEGVIIINPDPSDATVGLAPRTGDAPLVQYAPYRRAALERLAGQSK